MEEQKKQPKDRRDFSAQSVEPVQNVGNEVKVETKKKRENFFSAKKIATMAIFTALSFVVSLFDFPLFPDASFLKLDFGNVFIMLIGFLFGPTEGIIVCVLKEVLHIPFGSTGGVGELANILVTVSYILLPSFLYRFKKGLKVVIPSLIGGVLLMTCVALVANRYITFPLFMQDGAEAAFAAFWQIIVYFNLIKGTIISVLTCLLYKTLSRFLDKF